MKARDVRELVIVGGGPAGIAAALEARRVGVETLLVDERPGSGGQLGEPIHAWRSERIGGDDAAPGRLSAALGKRGAEVRTDTVAWGIWDREVVLWHPEGGIGVVEARQIILATGAHDRPVIFPGWTLDGVVGANDALSRFRSDGRRPERRTLVAGSGSHVFKVAANLVAAGASVAMVLQTLPSRNTANLLGRPEAATDDVDRLPGCATALAYLHRERIPVRWGYLIVGATGSERVEHAVIAPVDSAWHPLPDAEEAIDVDAVCLAYGEVPASALSRLAGCAHVWDPELGGEVPRRDEWLRTTVPGVLVAGGAGGATGAVAAFAEGRLAGIAAALAGGQLGRAEAERRAAPIRRRLRAFRQLQSADAAAFPVGPGIDELATPDTIICRCEKVTAAAIQAAVDESDDPNTVKALTRAGMGRCQGRNCARPIAAIVARRTGRSIDALPTFTPRPPVRPIPLGALARYARPS